MFSKKPTPKEAARAQKRQINRAQRDMQRDYRGLERQEKAIELEIKKAAKAGNKQLAATYAKQLVQVRKQKNRNLTTTGKMAGIGHQMTAMQSNVAMATSMGTATEAMAGMNKEMDAQKLAKTMQNFEKESMKMDMAEEIMGDTLDDLLGASDEEEESDAIVNQVLDEIGIDINDKLAATPAMSTSKPQASRSKGLSDEDKEIENMLAKLKAT